MAVSAPLALPESVGQRLRAYRAQRGMTVRALAQAVDVSPSLISQIENGRVTPSVGRLYAIVTVLGISLDELFRGAEDDRVDTDTGSPPTRRAGSPWQAPSEGPVLRGVNRPRLTLDSGVAWERLTAFEHSTVDFLHVVYDVGAESCPADDLMTHEGEEFGLVLSGRLGATVGLDSFELGPTDSIAFPSLTPHRFWTIGDEPTTVVWTVIGRANDPRVASS